MAARREGRERAGGARVAGVRPGPAWSRVELGRPLEITQMSRHEAADLKLA